MSRWKDGGVANVLFDEVVIKSVGIASALGVTSRFTWLKLPVVDNMERVMAVTTLSSSAPLPRR